MSEATNGPPEPTRREDGSPQDRASGVEPVPAAAALLRRITEIVLAGSGADWVHLEGLDAERAEVVVIASSGVASPPPGARIPYPGSLTERVLEREEPELVGPGEMASRPVAGLLPNACPERTVLAVPLRPEGEVLGALVLGRASTDAPFTPEEVGRARALGDMAALALRNARVPERLAPGLRVGDETERRFRLLVQSVRDYAIFMLDPEGRVVSWNEGAQRIRGYTEEEVLGRHFSLFYTEEDRERGAPERELEAAAREGTYQEEGWRLRKDGTLFWARVTMTAVYDEQKELVGFAKVTQDLTERRAAEEALRESDERFRQLAENAREVFWLYDVDFTQPLYISPAYETVWGRPVEELYRNANVWAEAVHPDDRERAMALTAELRERRSAAEYRIIRPDGVTRWILVRGFPIRDAAGEVIRIGGVTEDVTEEKETELRLQFLAEASGVLGSSLEYRETLKNVARLAVPHVADWCVVDVLEEGGIQRLGVAHVNPEKEALALELARRYPPDVHASAGVAAVLRTGEPQLLPEISEALLEEVAQDEEHHRLLRELGLRSSMIVPMRTRGRTLGAITLIAAESGRRFGPGDLSFAEELAARAALAVDNARLYREATEARGEAERRAREEMALRRAAEAVTASFTIEEVIHEISANSLSATNADGAFVQRIHLEGDEVEVVAAVGELIPSVGSCTPYAGSYTQLVVRSGEAVVVPSLAEATATLSDGIMQACGDCSAMVVPLIDAGEAIGALVLTRRPEHHGFRPDETERARTFADLASLAFRKIHLLQESEKRREEVESVMESRARLIRGFSHDLKNPLGAADGYLELIEIGVMEDPEKREHSIARARRAIRSALGLIQDLTDLARAEAGQITVEPAPVDVREVVREMTEEYRAQAEAKGLEIRYVVPEELPLIQSDPSRLRQVLGNLVSNAVKYTEEGRIEVSVPAFGTREGAPTSGQWVAIDVIDTGSGIPPEKRHLLFREFTRLEPSTTPGAGLGLAISQRVAEALAGQITVESEPGRGSVFTLWLPLGPGAGEPDGPREDA